MATFSSIFGIKSSHTSKHHPHVLQSASSSTSSMTPLTAPASVSDDKNFAVLKELASLSCNRNCFDCLQRGPTYVNMTIGSFICTSCSGKLRGLNPPHRVKSISMAVFSDEEIEFLKSRGNDFCQKVWLGKYPGPLLPLEKENDSKLMDILTARYERKCWYISPSDPMYDEARKRAEMELNRKNKSTSSICKTTQTELSNSRNQSTILPAVRPQQVNHGNSTPQTNASNSKYVLQSSSLVRSPLKTFSPVTPQSLPSSDSPKFSFQPVATEFADFTNFSGSSPTLSSSCATFTNSNFSQAFPTSDTPQKIVPGLPHNPYHASLQTQNTLANSQDKYAPFHELTSDMESLSINWNSSRFSGDFSSHNAAWKNGEQFVPDSSENFSSQAPGRNPFTGATSNINQDLPGSSQFHLGMQQQCLHYPGFVPGYPPSTNPYAVHVHSVGLNQPVYDGMLYRPGIPTGATSHRYNYQNSPQTAFMYQMPYYYQGYLQYNPSNPFLSQQMESRNTNPFL